jgi:hypothetical protein
LAATRCSQRQAIHQNERAGVLENGAAVIVLFEGMAADLEAGLDTPGESGEMGDVAKSGGTGGSGEDVPRLGEGGATGRGRQILGGEGKIL